MRTRTIVFMALCGLFLCLQLYGFLASKGERRLKRSLRLAYVQDPLRLRDNATRVIAKRMSEDEDGKEEKDADGGKERKEVKDDQKLRFGKVIEKEGEQEGEQEKRDHQEELVEHGDAETGLVYSTKLEWIKTPFMGSLHFIGSAHEHHYSETQSVIRIIAESGRPMPSLLTCQLMNSTQKGLTEPRAANARRLGGNARRNWVTLECGWHADAASVRVQHKQGRAFTVPILRAPRESMGFGVCVSPSFRYRKASQMQEFLNYYTYAGAHRIYLYKHSWSEEVEQTVVRHVASHPEQVTVFPWWKWDWRRAEDKKRWKSMDGMPELDCYEDFQQLSMNHCALQSHSDGVKFSAHIDLDERIFARKVPIVQGWALQFLKQYDGACGINIRSAYTEPCSILTSNASKVIHSHTNVYEHGTRSKEIAQNAVVSAVAVHTIHSCFRKRATRPEPDEVIIFHMNDGNLCKGVWPCPGHGFTNAQPAFTSLIAPFCHLR
jgi:hypothetical protein